MSLDAEAVIGKLRLERHPEGGWYRETWRAAPLHGGRSAATAIHFLLRRHERSAWHRIDADEVWLHQAGGALTLKMSSGAGVVQHRLGPDLMGGDLPQAVVGAGKWQSAETDADWALVACIVAPGFDFSGFELAPHGFDPDRR